jgi:arginyl-tRNA synthetase
VLNELKARYNVDVAQLPGADLSQLTSPQACADAEAGRVSGLLTHAANELAPHAVAFYLRDLAGEFHSFYNAERVLVDEAPRNARAALLAATRQVLRTAWRCSGYPRPPRCKRRPNWAANGRGGARIRLPQPFHDSFCR